MSKQPELRIAGFPRPEDIVGPPYNLEIPFDGRWISLATIGVTNFGGPGSGDSGRRYMEAVEHFTRLFLAAPALLEALEDISTMADARDANDAARAAIAQAKPDA